MSFARPDQAFQVGQTVRRVNDPTAVGLVVEARRDSQSGEWMYKVKFGLASSTVPEGALCAFIQDESPWDLLLRGAVAGVKQFVFAITYHRLRNPPARIANSFATTRTLFFPHQFIPLLKFLENPGKRLLIADDVGLGKTIEAAYILRELEAQEPLERVLVLVPARLGPKWKREFEERFHESFTLVKGSQLAQAVKAYRRGQELDRFRWIVSYESARSSVVREALDGAELPVNLLIADEAHRMRNSETHQHRIGSALCSGADAVVFLSATPVQNRLEDLWNLFRLLEPEQFGEWDVFEDQMRSHRGLVAAQRDLAARQPNFEGAREKIVGAVLTWRGETADIPEFAYSVLDRMSQPHISPDELAELRSDVGRLSPLTHMLTRTRKIEAMPNRPVRQATWLRVKLTPAEQTIYDSVEELCGVASRGPEQTWGQRMALMMAYRMTASCIPAAIKYYGSPSGATADPLGDFHLDDDGFFDDIEDSETPALASDEVANVFRHAPQVETDSKLLELLAAFALMWDEDDESRRPRRKVILFSTFRGTLEYLRAALRDRSIECRMIHGGIPVDARHGAIREFLGSDDVMVLLSSEVGGEGLDLQEASVVINYDLPWNPMVVEQRIGRVDRIGQQSSRIVIVNMIVDGSIEERVLSRLFDKIQIFSETVGEMEEILGEEIENLTRRALSGELSPEEVEVQVERTGQAIQNRVQEARQVLSQMDGLYAADQSLVEEINAIVGERQIPSERELWSLLNRFLESSYPGCQLPRSALDRVVNIRLGPVATDLEAAAGVLGSEAQIFARRIGTGAPAVTMSREAAYSQPNCELIHFQHPLTQFAMMRLADVPDVNQSAFTIQLETDRVPPGDYAFLVASFVSKGPRQSSRFVPILTRLDGGATLYDPEVTRPFVVEILTRGEDAVLASIDERLLGEARDRLLEGLDALRATFDERERKRAAAMHERKFGIRRVTLEHRVKRARESERKLVETEAADFALRMARAKLSKAEEELRALLETPGTPRWEPMEYEEVALGVLRIVGVEEKNGTSLSIGD